MVDGADDVVDPDDYVPDLRKMLPVSDAAFPPSIPRDAMKRSKAKIKAMKKANPSSAAGSSSAACSANADPMPGPIEYIHDGDDMAEMIARIVDEEASIKRESMCIEKANGLKHKHQEKLIAGDGNCFFRAVALQTPDGEAWHKRLRSAVVEEVQQHRALYKDFFIDCTLENWLRNMAKDQHWCDNAAVHAAANVLG